MSAYPVVPVDRIAAAVESHDDAFGVNWGAAGKVATDVGIRVADVETARGGSSRQGESSAQEGDCEYQDFFHLLVFLMVSGAGGCDAALAERIRRKFQTDQLVLCRSRNENDRLSKFTGKL